MKITLFGATGKTGAHLIAQGLERGFDITVVARPRTAFEHAKVRVVHGDLTDNGFLRDAVRGSDAALSALGPSKFPHPKDLPITRATEAIVAAMKQENVNRLIAVSTGTAADPQDRFQFKIRFPAVLIRYAAPAVYRDIIGLADAVRGSGLDWTMPRLAVLTDGPLTGRLNVGLYGHTAHSFTMSRADVAKFMLDQIGSDELVGQAPGISAA